MRNFHFLYPPKQKVKTGSKKRLLFFCIICSLAQQCWESGGDGTVPVKPLEYGAEEAMKEHA